MFFLSHVRFKMHFPHLVRFGMLFFPQHVWFGMFSSSARTIWNVFFSLILCDLECFFPHLVQFGMFFYLTLYDLECVFFSPYTIWNVLFPHLVQFRMFFLPDLVRFEMFFPQLVRFGMVFFPWWVLMFFWPWKSLHTTRKSGILKVLSDKGLKGRSSFLISKFLPDQHLLNRNLQNKWGS